MVGKFALLVLLIIVALWLLRFLGVLASHGRRQAAPEPRRPRPDRGRPDRSGAERGRIEDMRRCPSCGVYVPAAAPHRCGNGAAGSG